MGNSQTLSCASGEKRSKAQKKEEMYTKKTEDTNGVETRDEDKTVDATPTAQENGVEKSEEVPIKEQAPTDGGDSPKEPSKEAQAEPEEEIQHADESSPETEQTEAAPAPPTEQPATTEANKTEQTEDKETVEEDKQSEQGEVSAECHVGSSASSPPNCDSLSSEVLAAIHSASVSPVEAAKNVEGQLVVGQVEDFSQPELGASNTDNNVVVSETSPDTATDTAACASYNELATVTVVEMPESSNIASNSLPAATGLSECASSNVIVVTSSADNSLPSSDCNDIRDTSIESSTAQPECSIVINECEGTLSEPIKDPEPDNIIELSPPSPEIPLNPAATHLPTVIEEPLVDDKAKENVEDISVATDAVEPTTCDLPTEQVPSDAMQSEEHTGEGVSPEIMADSSIEMNMPVSDMKREGTECTGISISETADSAEMEPADGCAIANEHQEQEVILQSEVEIEQPAAELSDQCPKAQEKSEEKQAEVVAESEVTPVDVELDTPTCPEEVSANPSSGIIEEPDQVVCGEVGLNISMDSTAPEPNSTTAPDSSSPMTEPLSDDLIPEQLQNGEKIPQVNVETPDVEMSDVVVASDVESQLDNTELEKYSEAEIANEINLQSCLETAKNEDLSRELPAESETSSVQINGELSESSGQNLQPQPLETTESNSPELVTVDDESTISSQIQHSVEPVAQELGSPAIEKRVVLTETEPHSYEATSEDHSSTVSKSTLQTENEPKDEVSSAAEDKEETTTKADTED